MGRMATLPLGQHPARPQGTARGDLPRRPVPVQRRRFVRHRPDAGRRRRLDPGLTGSRKTHERNDARPTRRPSSTSRSPTPGRSTAARFEDLRAGLRSGRRGRPRRAPLRGHRRHHRPHPGAAQQARRHAARRDQPAGARRRRHRRHAGATSSASTSSRARRAATPSSWPAPTRTSWPARPRAGASSTAR